VVFNEIANFTLEGSSSLFLLFMTSLQQRLKIDRNPEHVTVTAQTLSSLFWKHKSS